MLESTIDSKYIRYLKRDLAIILASLTVFYQHILIRWK